MRKFIISSLAMAVIASCSSSNDEIPESNNNGNDANVPYLVTKFTETTQDNQTFVTEYKYNGDKITEENNITQNYKIVYTYNGDDIVKTEKYVGTTLDEKREFIYSNGKLTTEKVTSKFNSSDPQMMVYTINYQYLSSTHIKFNRRAGITPIPSGGYIIEYNDMDAYLSAGGNLASVSYTHNGTTYNTNNTYDNANSPMKNVKGYIKINMFKDYETGYNNLVSQSNNYSGTVNGTAKIYGNYTFNNADYPTKAVMTYTSSSFGTNSHTYLYEYNK
ncbi:hypothetical protein [Chryseobacterium culicis]|uniref:hypothetical protein n=1 Tax=Chryseobacterium culicis TaxID=680127 RepID=UPI00187662BA|nr:hypothetical protein [Chryseobacterium culicis]MBE4950267.1 hypothetical protein [Chryseobacterium culicis]